MRFSATFHAFAENKIRDLIDPKIYESIKQSDPSPVFRAYIVGQEGDTKGNWIGIGKIVKRWYKSAVKKIHDVLDLGTKVFQGHIPESNEHVGRIQLGEIVGKAFEQIKGVWSTVAVAYIYPAFKSLPLDIASIEANVFISEDQNQGISDADVQSVTGVALGNSQYGKPGFPGATAIGELQAFYKSNISRFQAEGGSMTTIDEVKIFVKAEGLKPSDLFGADDLTGDAVVKGYMAEVVKEKVAGEFAHRKRTEEAFDKARTEWEGKEKEFNEKIANLTGESGRTKALDILKKIAKEREFDPTLTKYIEARMDNFKPENLEDLEKEFDGFVDSQIDNFDKDAKIFGIDVKSKDKDKDKDADKDKDPDKDKSKSDLADPEKNPFIPKVATP